MEEFQQRITAQGARYCALALELILGTPCEEPPAEEPPAEPPAEEPQVFDPVFDGEFVFDEIPAEPAEEILDGGE